MFEEKGRVLYRLLPFLSQASQSAGAPSDTCRYEGVVIYLHGFPDMSVHPHRPEFASRFPRKLMESVLEAFPAWGFLCFNFSGIPGSAGCFHDKTLIQEVCSPHKRSPLSL